MKHEVRMIIIAALILIVSAGCAGHRTFDIVPREYPIKPGHVHPVDTGASSTVKLVNGYTAGTKTLVYDQKPRFNTDWQYYGDFRKWTEIAQSVLSSELSRMGFRVSTNSNKKVLTLKVIRAEMIIPKFGTSQVVDISVQTGDGKTRIFSGKSNSGYAISPKAVEATAESAITKALIHALQDSGIRDYLSQ
ncbi:MAG: hypothetical protein OEZ10_01080 [Gammaproteobacteria bacterium]|nr:hypothetical protein [Gammaproteobacteria bacterium]